MENKKSKKGIIIACIIFAVAVLAFFLIYTNAKSKGTGGSKNIEIVVDADGAKTEYKLSTDQEYLQGALDELAKAQKFSYKGVKQTAGYLIQEVNGVKAIYEETGSYWAIYVNDEYAQYGIIDQPVKDGDKYKLAIEKM